MFILGDWYWYLMGAWGSGPWIGIRGLVLLLLLEGFGLCGLDWLLFGGRGGYSWNS